jgi:hypothetical protein
LVRPKSQVNREKAVAYLKAGTALVLTTQLLRNVFDRSHTPSSRSILADGTERHMAENESRVPSETDLEGLGIG